MDILDKQRLAGLKGDYTLGWKLAQKLKAEQSDNPRGVFNRGWYLMANGDLRQGFECMEEGRFSVPQIWGNTPLADARRLWAGEDINGRIILINMEAGMGDQIVYFRFIKILQKLHRTAKIILVCDKVVFSIFENNGFDLIAPEQVKTTLHDFWFPSMRLPLALKLEQKDLSGEPYLLCDEKNKLPKVKKKIGLRWWSNPAVYERAFPPNRLLSLTEAFPHFTFYSLQRDAGTEFGASYPLVWPDISSWKKTKEVISDLDLVISSCTSVAHLSAAMGKETWVIVPLLAWYPWGHHGEKTLWYDSVKIFRQQKFMEWQPTFREIKKCLSLI